MNSTNHSNNSSSNNFFNKRSKILRNCIDKKVVVDKAVSMLFANSKF